MATVEKKKWHVQPAIGQAIVIEAETMELNEQSARVVFMNGEEVVATFVGSNAVYPVPEADTEPETTTP